MKTLFKAGIIFLCTIIVAACSENISESERTHRKIYLTEEDYLEDLTAEAVKERREAPAQVESDYIFNIQPLVEDNVYFFDERQQPKIPGQPSAKDYKHEKRLWTKPRRYTPDEYYGLQGGSSGSSSSYEESSSSSEYY